MKLRGPLYFDTGPRWQAGAGSPEGTVTAPVGSMYSRTDGGADTAVYRKETGTGNTGWVPIADVYVNTTAPPGTPNVGDAWYSPTAGTGLILPLPLTNGGTAATNAPAARTNLGVRAGGDSTSVAGAPTAGTWARGDTWLDSLNVLWVCTVGGTPGTWISNMNRGEELAYNQITTPVTITTTNSVAQQTVIAGTTRSYDGTPVIIEFYSPRVDCPVNSQTLIHLRDGAADLGYFVLVLDQAGNTGAVASAKRRITPTAGTHTYNITGWAGVASGGYVAAGTGDANATFSPAFLRITRA